MSKRSRKTLLKIVKAAVSLALIVFALYAAGLLEEEGWRAVISTILASDYRYLLLSLCFIPLMDFISTVKWKALSTSRGLQIGFWRLFVYYVIGRFYNLVLPSSIGGDLIRVHLVGRYTNRYADSAAVVFVERFSGVIVLVALTGIAAFFATVGISANTLVVLLLVATVGLATVLWLVLSPLPIRYASNFFRDGGIFSRITSKIQRLQASIRDFRHQKAALAVALLNSLIFYAFAILNVWVSVLVFDSSVSFVSMLFAVPVIMFIMNIPISIGSIGLMEFSYTIILMQVGLSGEIAIATALLMRLKLLLAGCIGGLLYMFHSTEKLDLAATDELKN